ncbi:MAG: flagellar assembly protein FliH [Spirochaetales bacterium]
MAKNVFRSNEVQYLGSKVFITGPENDPVASSASAEVQPVEEYEGPTADDLRREAELFRTQWEQEKAKMISDARAEADRIVKEAENLAFEEVRTKSEHAQALKTTAENEAARIKEQAGEEAERINEEARGRATEIEQEARDRGYTRGRQEGFEQGEAELDRLVDRLHVIINKTIARREEIIEETESQLVHLVLEIARKVVKVISENQKNIVVNNVVQALRKLKSKADVNIRVNIDDLKVVSEHAEEFVSRIERVENVTVMEDSTVDRGGAVIETDFGEIDARIASQLREIEDRILELVPISSRPARRQSQNESQEPFNLTE